MFFLAQAGTPETSDYLALGYAIAGIIYLVTFGTIWLRHRSLNKDEALLERLEAED